LNRIAPSYNEKYLEVERPKPLSDQFLEYAQLEILEGNIDKNISDAIYDEFKILAEEWIFSSTLNNLTGITAFSRKDIIIGCTQFIDSIYMKGDVQVLENDYRYHERLKLASFSSIGKLKPNIPLIISLPFPQVGSVHDQMAALLEESINKNIPVHIDGAWITCCKNVNFDFDHPAIKSVGISLSKGLGLGWNRIGLRWSRETTQDAITIMNNFSMNNRALVMIGLHFLKKFPPDYLWKKYEKFYDKVCYDFKLEKTKSIHLALKAGSPVGVSPLIRYLMNNENSM
jgi:hypothetical protein